MRCRILRARGARAFHFSLHFRFCASRHGGGTANNETAYNSRSVPFQASRFWETSFAGIQNNIK
jgi:hypothetical protein